MKFINKLKNEMQQDIAQFKQVNNELPLKTKILLYAISVVLLVVVMASIIFIKDPKISMAITLIFGGIWFFLTYIKKNKSKF